MLRELTEVTQIVEGDWPHSAQGRKPTEAELRGALQALLTRQCIYSHTSGLTKVYELIRLYAPFFSAYFGALGYSLVVSPRDQMVALQVPTGETRYDAVYERLRKDETIVLLAMRLLWNEAVSNQNIVEGGICETTTAELIDRIKTLTQQNPPTETRLDEIIRHFARHGAVRAGEKDRMERVSPLSILPGISILAPDNYVDELLLWAASPPDADRNRTSESEEEQI